MTITPQTLLASLLRTVAAQIETTKAGQTITAAGFGPELRQVGEQIARNAAGGIFGVLCEALESAGFEIDDDGCVRALVRAS